MCVDLALCSCGGLFETRLIVGADFHLFTYLVRFHHRFIGGRGWELIARKAGDFHRVTPSQGGVTWMVCEFYYKIKFNQIQLVCRL